MVIPEEPVAERDVRGGALGADQVPSLGLALCNAHYDLCLFL